MFAAHNGEQNDAKLAEQFTGYSRLAARFERVRVTGFFHIRCRRAPALKSLGFRVNRYIDRIELPIKIRCAIAQYLAALLVRHPDYLAKLTQFHEDSTTSSVVAREHALDDMLYMYRVYAERISRSLIMVTRRVGSSEYLYADGGLIVDEPWRDLHGVPFDIHALITPDLAIEVVPLPFDSDMTSAAIMEATNQGVARQNRIVLAGAKRFVFSRQTPPLSFIKEHFAKPAPRNIGYRIVDDRLETRYEPGRI